MSSSSLKNLHQRHRICAALICAASFAGPALVAADPLDVATGRLEADIRAIGQARQGQWVELPTGSWATREFVHELQRRKSDNAALVQLRLDYMSAASDGAASEVQTVWLYCNEGTKRVVAVEEFDMEGRQTSLRITPDAPVERIKNLYAGTEQLICSDQYLLLEVADGYRRLSELLTMRKQARSEHVPDRVIPTRTTVTPQPSN